MANETKIYVGEQGAKALYKRLKEQLGKITTYQKVTNVTPEGVPIVAKPNTRTIYLVKDETVIGDDRYKEWIWNSVDLWECIGTTSIPENAWKQWSEDNGSTGSADSVYIGKNIVLGRDETYSLGKGNVVKVTDDTDYTDTDVVAIGTGNTATNAANAYQLGRENSVIDNNLAAKLDYPHSMALNLGRNNIITGEGVNVGKDNNATTFGINIGQNNFSSNASCSVGQHVMSDHSSLSMGNGEPTSATATVGNVPSMLVNGKYAHVQQFRLKDRYHLCELATIYQDPTDNKYKWAAVQSTRLHIFPNYELDQYLVSWGSYSQGGTITGYYDEEGVFHESSDTSHNIHTYGKITNVGNPSGSSRVDLNPPFYASFLNQEETRNSIVYVMRAEITLPAYGTILTRSEYEALIAGAVTPVMMGSISDLFINLDDLTADGYKLPGLTGNNALPFPLSYEVYGYKDNDVLIPYNELNKDEMHDFDWYEVDRSVIQGNTLPVKQVNPRAELIVADDRSATFGMGSLYAGGRSITISTNTNSTYQMRYRGTYETNVFHTYSGTRYTIDQETGNYSSTSATISCFTSNYGQFNSKVAPYCASADGGSIVISNNYGTAYGSSIAIGNYANADGFSYVFGESSTASGKSFAFGKAAFGYEYSMALGFDNAYASKRSIALGISGVNAQNDSIAIGFNGLYSSDHSLAFGYGGYADDKAICIGFSNYATGQSVAIGDNNSTSGGGVAIGITNRGLGGNTMSGTCIGLGISNSVGGNSFVAGNGCLGNNASIVMGIGSSAKDGSISFGIGCSGYRGAILLGIGNYTSSSDSAYGNAVVMGFGNQVYNVRQSLNKTGWTGTVTACGIAIGSYITGYGHNFISFGSKNILGDPAHWSEDGHDTVTDNDGFMTAVGFQCTAKRNYDFAYGYQSVANGGENIAFQHSTATGYRNIAIVDSTLTDCTANIALCESSLTLNNVYSPKTNVIHNTLLHSKITATLGNTSNNMFMHTNGSITTSSASGIHRNTIMVGTEYHPVSITSEELSNNIIYGFRRGAFLAKSFTDNSGPVAISTGGSFDRNIMLNNAYGACTSPLAMNDNIIHSTELNVSGVSYFSDNIIASSLVNITRAANVVNNVMLGRSKIDIQATATEANNNFLMYSYLGDNNNGSAISTGEYSSQASTGYMTQNFLVGSNAYNVQSTVSFATPSYSQAPECAYYDGYYNGEYPQSSQLIDCANVFNFGDNLIKGVNRAAVFGMAHNIHSSMNAFVYGTHNELSYTDGSIVMGERNYVLGMKQAYHDDVTHTIILGSNNNVKATNQADYNMIFGANNNIKGDFTVVTKTSAQIASLPSNVKEYIKASADCIYPTSSTLYYIYKNYYYFYSNGCLLTNYSTKPTGVSTIVDVSDVSTFVSLYNRRSLTEGTWYHVLNTGSSYRIDAPSGALVKSTKVYYHYNSTLVELGNYSGSTGDIAIYNSFNRIFGNANNLYDHVMNYTLVGEGNSVKCTDYSIPYDYAISNGFVQGNSNIALNGSNIICMGNGNQSTGHNSVAIGSQLISNQWQTVLGKYNAAIAGPNRLASETPQDPTKALLIVGNGYSTKDDSSWQDESFITRSNALELYADGRLKISGKIEASNIPPAPVADGQYALACEVVSGVATYRWVAVGSN